MDVSTYPGKVQQTRAPQAEGALLPVSAHVPLLGQRALHVPFALAAAHTHAFGRSAAVVALLLAVGACERAGASWRGRAIDLHCCLMKLYRSLQV